MTSPLFVRRLALKDIRCFTHLDIEFKPGESILVIGDNGAGKSTVLRALAMGLCDQSSASALFRELHGDYVRAGSTEDEGTIEVELVGGGGTRYRIETTIKSLETFERVDQKLFRITGRGKQKLHEDDFPWHRVFASGYGAGIRVLGTSDFDYYLTVDAVYPLFRYDVMLQNPELVIRRLIDAARRARGGKRAANVLTEIEELLEWLLQLQVPERVDLTPRGIFVKTPDGQIGLSALADGYRGTVTWVLDLIAWWFVYRQDSRSTRFLDVSGIVLIDEIEQHLHPRWQRNIMRLLTDSFPNVQFIATTHSPLVASGCEGIPVHRLSQDEPTHTVVSPFGWLAEDVYEVMGVSGSRAKTFMTDVLGEYRRLDEKRLENGLSKAEQARLAALRRRMRLLPSDDPIRLTTELENLAKRAKLLKDQHS